MNPTEVISPKSKVKKVYMVFNQKEEGFALATLLYGESVRIGIRWNGEENELGYPHSHGYPTWFIIPKNVALYYAIKKNDKKMIEAFTDTADDIIF